MKICTVCETPKDLSGFNKQARSKDGYSSYCRVCANIKVKKWRIENAEHRSRYEKQYNKDNAKDVAARTRNWRENNPEKVTRARKRFYRDNPERNLVYEARKRAKTRQVPCTINFEDIVIPSHCPVLGTMLERSGMNNRDSSPSLDCVIPSLGYVPGNIAVISYRANRIKNDATAEEVLRVYKYMKAFKRKLNGESTTSKRQDSSYANGGS